LRKPSTKLISILSQNIKKIRQKMGISQEELAHRCGLHRTYIGAIERGERNITLSSLEIIASTLDVDIPTLLDKDLNLHG